MRLTSTADIICKIAGVIAILLLVRSASQGWLVLLIYGSASVASTSYMYCIALSEYGLCVPSAEDVISVLQDGISLFVFQASVALYTSANVFILGLFVGPYAVGIYAGAERITKSVLQLLGPINQALYPRMNAIIHRNREAGGAIIRRAFWLVLGLTTGLAVLLVAAAPILVRILLGSQFHESVLTIRILALLLPIIGASNMLGVQWMLPLRKDRAFNTMVVTSGVLNVCLAASLARRYAGNGMAVAVVCSELFVTAGCFGYLWFHKLNPVLSVVHADCVLLSATGVVELDAGVAVSCEGKSSED